MTAKPDLLPCPFCGGTTLLTDGDSPICPVGHILCDDCYASADSTRWNQRATAAKDAEIEALRAEVDEWKDMARCASEQQDSLFREALALSARVERLAEALRLALDSHGKTLLTDPPQDAWKVNRVEEIGRALLRDQEE